MTQIKWSEDPCRFAHAWVAMYRWSWHRWWFRRHFYEKCLDCEMTRGR